MSQSSNRSRNLLNVFGSEQIEELKEAFSLFDEDGSGSISADELHMIMKSLGKNTTMEEIQIMINEVDDDGSGEIEFPEFLELISRKMQKCDSMDEMKQAFAVFDRDKSGSVSASELSHVMRNYGEEVSEKDIENMINNADFDKDGELSFDDFYTFLMRKGLVKRAKN